MGGGAGQVARGGHAGAGASGQRADEVLARFAFGHVTAVQQDVGVTAQCGADDTEVGAALVQLLATELQRAELQAARCAVRNEVQAGDVAPGFQRLGDLAQAVALAVEHHHVHVIGAVADEFPIVGDIIFDKQDLFSRLD
ncbi:hypothetical protein D3C87_1135530 [compost metagenome]